MIDAVFAAVGDQTDRVVFTWPDKLQSPLGATLAAALALHEADLARPVTIAFYPYGLRLKTELRRLFVDEVDLAARALARITSREKSEWGGPIYHYDYLLRATASAKVSGRKAGLGGEPVLSPNLFELVPIFEPSDDAQPPYSRGARNFLADLGGKRELLREKPQAASCASDASGAPVCVFGLPEDAQSMDRCLRFTRRLRAETDVVVVDLTRADLRKVAETMSRLRRVKNSFATNVGGRPAFVVACADPFLADRCREILADATSLDASAAGLPLVSAVLKTQSVDFSTTDGPLPGRDAPKVSVLVKTAQVAKARKEWLPKARDLQTAGCPEAAEAIRGGIAFLQEVASLPVGYDFFIQSVEGAEEERRVSVWGAKRFKEIEVASMLMSAADEAGPFREDLVEFRRYLLDALKAFRQTTEVSECLRDFLERASRKANRTVVVVRNPMIEDALREFIDEGGFDGVEAKRLLRKLTLCTPRTVDVAAVDVHGSARVDTLVVLQPTIECVKRIASLPVLPEVVLVGDAGALGRARQHLVNVKHLVPELAARLEAFIVPLAVCDDPDDGGTLEGDAQLPFSTAITLDFSGSGQAGGSDGPKVVIRTTGGYQLVYRAQGECVVRRDDRNAPFHQIEAGKVAAGDEIMIMTGRLEERLDTLLGPVEAGDDTFLRLYRSHVQDRADQLPGKVMREKACHLLGRMHDLARANGSDGGRPFGKNELQNVARWLSARPDDESRQPRAPREKRAFRYFMTALGVDEALAAQFWGNSIVRTRAENVSAGFRENQRAMRFLVNPHQFYARFTEERAELRVLWDEMATAFEEVVSCVKEG